MGMRSYKVVCLLAVVCLLVSSFAWGAISPVPYDAPGPGDVVNGPAAVAYYYDDARFEALIDIGWNEGLRPDAEVGFYRNGEEVARGKVVTVRSIDAVVKPDQGTPGGAIHRGDQVRVIANGSRQAADKARMQEQRTETLLSVGFTLLLGALIAIERS